MRALLLLAAGRTLLLLQPGRVMSEPGVIPRPEDRLVSDTAILTDWHVEGEFECPDCGRSFYVDCGLDDLVKFSAVHECGDGFMPP